MARWWWLVLAVIRFTLAVRKTAVVLFMLGSTGAVSRRYPQIGLGLRSLSFSYMLVLI